jgi:PKHD-type hydroxylase
MQSPIRLWPGAIAPDDCTDLLAEYSELPYEKAELIGNAPDQYRVTRIRCLPTRTDDHLPKVLMDYADNANRSMFGFDIRAVYDVQLAEYRAEDGAHFGWHVDSLPPLSTGVAFDRKLTVVVQLTAPTEYEGGNLEILGEGASVAEWRQQGTVIVFPSFLTHRVTPVTEGVRHSLVTWAEGPRWR